MSHHLTSQSTYIHYSSHGSKILSHLKNELRSHQQLDVKSRSNASHIQGCVMITHKRVIPWWSTADWGTTWWRLWSSCWGLLKRMPMIVMYSIVAGTCHQFSHQSTFACTADLVILADCLSVWEYKSLNDLNEKFSVVGMYPALYQLSHSS